MAYSPVLDRIRQTQFTSFDVSDVASVSSLPSYHSEIPGRERGSGARTEHSYHLKKGGKTPWATLRVMSNATSPKQLPVFLEGEAITGSVLLDFEQDSSIQKIIITVKGSILTGIEESETTQFLEQSSIIWALQTGSKPCGQLNQPFSITLQSTVNADTNTYRLPQSFKESLSKATVIYSFSVTFSRKKFRLNDEIVTTVTYIPVTRPDKSSIIRQLAYERRMPLPGPDEDTDGWEALPPVTVSGTIFESRSVQATCTLFIAKPLCYTRGTFIPCTIRIACNDDQALDVLASPSAVKLHLRRVIRYGSAVNYKKLTEESAVMAPGTWWRCEKTGNTSFRELQGEIGLPKSLQPTSAMLHLSIMYLVGMSQFDAPGFKPTSINPLLGTEVGIATRLAKGLQMQPYSSSPNGQQSLRVYTPRTKGFRQDSFKYHCMGGI